MTTCFDDIFSCITPQLLDVLRTLNTLEVRLRKLQSLYEVNPYVVLSNTCTSNNDDYERIMTGLRTSWLLSLAFPVDDYSEFTKEELGDLITLFYNAQMNCKDILENLSFSHTSNFTHQDLCTLSALRHAVSELVETLGLLDKHMESFTLNLYKAIYPKNYTEKLSEAFNTLHPEDFLTALASNYCDGIERLLLGSKDLNHAERI